MDAAGARALRKRLAAAGSTTALHDRVAAQAAMPATASPAALNVHAWLSRAARQLQ